MTYGDAAASGNSTTSVDATAGAGPWASGLALRGQEVQSLVRRWFVMLARDRLGLTFSIAQPAIWLAFFGSGVGRTVNQAIVGGNYPRFVLPGVVAFTVVGNGVSGAMPLLWDKETGYLDKMLTMPIARMSILASRIIAQILLGIAQVAVILVIAALLGAGVTLAPALLVMLVAALATVTTTSASLALAYSVRAHETFFAISGFLTIPLLFLSTAFVPQSAMSSWFGTASRVNPVSFAVAAMRGAIDGDMAAMGTGIAVSAGIAAGCLALAVACYRRRAGGRR